MPNEEELIDILEVTSRTAMAYTFKKDKVLALEAVKKGHRSGFKESIIFLKSYRSNF
ncbi:hypothetical protein [Priestia megaterium]|uniref:hypothetical protein n=1 Tax=Priestia megaterium TaxID=1404 RepID=UPI0015E47747|nr:hypothetical protein [Priestia megaterium]